jgi:endo-1,4-beta-xylanase
MILLLLFSIELPCASSQQLSTNKDKFLGAATSYQPLRNFFQYWNQLTPGNDGKWGSVSRGQGQYDWTNLDALYNYAMNLGLLYKHHNLVWGSQQPSWISGLDTASQRAAVEDWIRRVGQRYPKMNFVDVVNEPLHTPLPSYKTALGGDGVTGWDWVITAFQWARQYCAPGVKLILNEYNVLGSTQSATNFLTIINLLKDRNLIDGIGVQGHYFEFRSHIGATVNTYVYDLTTIKNNLNRLTATGLPVYISEFDIDEPIDSNQVAEYKIYFPILWSNPGVKGITFWGYIQNDVWSSYPNTYLLYSDERVRPAMQWLRTYVWSPQPPLLISPINQLGIVRNPLLAWQTSATATSYHVQISDNVVFVGTVVDTTVVDTTFRPSALAAKSTYYWRVSGVNQYGASDYSASGFVTGDLISTIEGHNGAPSHFGLSQNYPNPFNPSTSFEFRVASSEFVSLKVVDMLGREVATLVNANRQPGTYTVRWDATAYPSGVYFYRLQAGTFVETKKMILAK